MAASAGSAETGVQGPLASGERKPSVPPHRVLLGVRCVGFHVDPGVVVGGNRVLSGTVA